MQRRAAKWRHRQNPGGTDHGGEGQRGAWGPGLAKDRANDSELRACRTITLLILLYKLKRTE